MPDGVTPGFWEWLEKVAPHFKVVIHSSRSVDDEGCQAILFWLQVERRKWRDAGGQGTQTIEIEVSKTKPPAFVTIDDRALNFDGDWSSPKWSVEALLDFKPWMKREDVNPANGDRIAELEAQLDARDLRIAELEAHLVKRWQQQRPAPPADEERAD